MAEATLQANEPQKQAQPDPESAPKQAEKTESLWKDVWYSLRQNIPAMVSLFVILLLAIVAIVTYFWPQVLPYDPYAQDLSASFQPPSAAHWFGTDQQGRDIFSRVLIGSQISLTVGLLSVAISLVIGVVLGAVAGYKGGIVDTIIMRIMDMMLAIPSILLAIAFMAALGRGRNYIFSAPYAMIFPGLAITITVLAFNLLGDGIRDAFDPKARKR